MATLKPTAYIDHCMLGRKCLCGPLPLRQRQVLHRLVLGDAEKQIAAAIGLSTATVHIHLKALYRRFKVESRPELMAMVVKSAAGVGVRPRAIKHNIGLTEDQNLEIHRLLAIAHGGTRQQIRHAKILLRLDGESDDYTIAADLGVSIRTIERVRAAFLTDGLSAALAPCERRVLAFA